MEKLVHEIEERKSVFIMNTNFIILNRGNKLTFMDSKKTRGNRYNI